MKTEKQIKKEIATIESWHGKHDINTPAYRADGKKIKLLRQCVLYLQTNPSKGYLTETKKEIADKIKKIQANFEAWLLNTPESELPTDKDKRVRRNAYNKEMNLPTLKLQHKTLTYLLS